MRTLTALFALFAATACATAPCAHCERSRTAVVYTFVDTDDDGLPDTRVQQGLIDLGPEVVVYAPAKRHPVRTQPATRQPDVRAGVGFGFTSFGQSVFVDTDDDGLPDTRLPSFSSPTNGDQRIESALVGLEQAIAELRRELQQR